MKKYLTTLLIISLMFNTSAFYTLAESIENSNDTTTEIEQVNELTSIDTQLDSEKENNDKSSEDEEDFSEYEESDNREDNLDSKDNEEQNNQLEKLTDSSEESEEEPEEEPEENENQENQAELVNKNTIDNSDEVNDTESEENNPLKSIWNHTKFYQIQHLHHQEGEMPFDT